MKAMNDNSNGSNNNWLAFSLSPHMKMEVVTDPQHHHHQYHHHSQAASSVPTSFCLSSYLNGSGICYGVAESGGFHAPLSAMPLKSDGSCIIEAHRRSQSEGIAPASSRQLEDFLGGATEETYQYGSHERDAMALSLECLYYHQNTDQETKGNHSLALLQDPVRQQDQEFAIQIHPYYSGLACQGMYQSPLEEETQDAQLTDCDSQIPQMGEETMPRSKNWEARHYSIHSSLEQQMNSSMFNNGAASGSCCTMGCGDLQSRSLSMSPGSQSSRITAPRQISPNAIECLPMETETKGPGKMGQKLKQPVHRKSIDTFGQRTSQYRGVTRHRWTGRYEAHLWDNSCKKEGQTRKGRQVYLGGYDMEEKAARAYDLAALKYWGPSTHINFPLENYRDELEEMKKMSRQEYVAHLRRKSSGFSRGASTYRGVTRHHQHGRWQARIGRVAGNKDLYLGTFSTQEEAAEAYDIAAIKFRGVNAVTNFDITRYDVEKIMAGDTLLPGELARRNKETNSSNEATDYNTPMLTNGETIQHVVNNGNGSDWKKTLCQSTHQQLRTAGVESLNENSALTGSYRNRTFSMALQDLVGVDSVSSSQPTVDESTKLGTRSDPANGVNWFPSSAAELRAGALPISHLPVFAAWNDT